jgi:hypothetical protein
MNIRYGLDIWKVLLRIFGWLRSPSHPFFAQNGITPDVQP